MLFRLFFFFFCLFLPLLYLIHSTELANLTFAHYKFLEKITFENVSSAEARSIFKGDFLLLPFSLLLLLCSPLKCFKKRQSDDNDKKESCNKIQTLMCISSTI